jgi:hypothetical protein
VAGRREGDGAGVNRGSMRPGIAWPGASARPKLQRRAYIPGGSTVELDRRAKKGGSGNDCVAPATRLNRAAPILRQAGADFGATGGAARGQPS